MFKIILTYAVDVCKIMLTVTGVYNQFSLTDTDIGLKCIKIVRMKGRLL